MNLDLEGKLVVVAGASRGLGFSVVRELLSERARVFAIARSPESLTKAESSWRSTYPDADIRSLCLDLSKPEAVDVLRHAISSETSVHGLIVVAGSGTPSMQLPINAFDSAVRTNTLPALVAVQALGPLIRNTDGGAVVLISSIAAVEAISAPVEYAASKACLHIYSSYWSRDLRPARVNVVAPGNMLTGESIWAKRIEQDHEALNEWLETEVTLGRLGTPEEVAHVVVFMISNRASFMTGSTVIVDGGQVHQW